MRNKPHWFSNLKLCFFFPPAPSTEFKPLPHLYSPRSTILFSSLSASFLLGGLKSTPELRESTHNRELPCVSAHSTASPVRKTSIKLLRNPCVWREIPLPPGLPAQCHKMRHTARVAVMNPNHRGNNLMWEMGKPPPCSQTVLLLGQT